MIDLNDLRHSINRALNLGRYTVRVAVVGGEQVPSSIDLDLLERDDDLFGGADDMVAESTASVLDRVNTALDAEDDHGPTVPFQGTLHREAIESGIQPDTAGQKWKTFDPGPFVYEFAAQEIRKDQGGDEWVEGVSSIQRVELRHAPHPSAAAAADWVHVFDRVTRERRTLKRPEPDAVLKGLNDVAADLRAKPSGILSSDGPVRFEGRRGDPVDPPFGCYTPPVGPLTSTEGLKVGDLVRCIERWPVGDAEDFGEKGVVYSVVSLAGRSGFNLIGLTPGSVSVNRFAFVSRPGVWMPWSGGENPVPGMAGKVRLRNGHQYRFSSELRWAHTGLDGDIVAFMVIDTGNASSDT